MFVNHFNSPKNSSLKSSIDKITEITETSEISGTSLDGQNKKNCCKKCNKKVGLTGFTCRCGGLYCGNHRYAEEHSCNYDYIKFGKQELTTKLDNKGLSTKIEKI